MLWYHLRNSRLVVRFRRQHPIGPYIVDFFCEETRLAIELDGGGHADPEQLSKDREREAALRQLGIRMVRFWNTEVYENLDGVLRRILEDVSQRR